MGDGVPPIREFRDMARLYWRAYEIVCEEMEAVQRSDAYFFPDKPENLTFLAKDVTTSLMIEFNRQMGKGNNDLVFEKPVRGNGNGYSRPKHVDEGNGGDFNALCSYWGERCIREGWLRPIPLLDSLIANKELGKESYMVLKTLAKDYSTEWRNLPPSLLACFLYQEGLLELPGRCIRETEVNRIKEEENRYDERLLEIKKRMEQKDRKKESE